MHPTLYSASRDKGYIVAMAFMQYNIEYSNVSSDMLKSMKETMPELGLQFFISYKMQVYLLFSLF